MKQELIKVMCNSLVGRKIRLTKNEYISFNGEQIIRYYNGKPEDGDIKVDAEIISIELYDVYPLDRLQVKIKDNDIERYILLNITEKIKLV
jgi:hypothetical protein